MKETRDVKDPADADRTKGGGADAMAALDAGLPPGRRGLATFGLLMALLMTVLDAVLVNIALPTMASDLGVTPARAVWIVTTYQLTAVIGLLPFASLGEIYGYRRVMLIGLVVFTLMSLFCAFAPTIELLTLGRAIEGLASAAVMSVFPALIRFVHPPHLLGRAIGLNAMTVAVGSALGPTVASTILAFKPWPWLFGVNVPVGLLALAICWRMLPRVPLVAHRFDVRSAIVNALAVGLLVFSANALVTAPARLSWSLPLVVALGWWLVRRAATQTAPLVPLDLLRLPPIAFAVGTSVATFAAYAGAYVSLPFHLQHFFGRTQFATGMLMTAWPAAAGIAAPLAGRLSDRIAAWKLCSLGAAMMGFGLLGLRSLPADATDPMLVACLMLTGAGFGCFQAPNNRTMLQSAPRERSGSAGGMQAMARQFGIMWGSTTVALIFAMLAQQDPDRQVLSAMAVGICYAFAGAAVSLARGWVRRDA